MTDLPGRDVSGYKTIRERFTALAGEGNVFADEPMAAHTTFRVGGPADYYVRPSDREALVRTVSFCREEGLDYFIIGNGSNLLVSDNGFRGVIIEIGKPMSQIRIDEPAVLTAEAGVMLAALSHRAAELGLKGLEFASGIPGTLGGAVFMNAGAYGGEMAQVVKAADVLTPEGTIKRYEARDLQFGYRRSAVRDQGLIVLSAEIELQEGNKDEIFELMEDLGQRRRDKQPLDVPSAGSTFKRPEGNFAGKLIMEAGLGGFAIGGAEVSKKHCGFIVNTNNASAKDIRDLIDHVTGTVYAKSGVALEPEVRFLGEF